MLGLGLNIFVIVTLLVAAVILIPVSRRSKVPHSILLVILGISLGLLLSFTQSGPDLPGEAFFTTLKSVSAGAGSIFYLLLVPMIFDTALKIDVRHLIDDLGPILLFAIIGTILSILFIGISLDLATESSLVACLMIGAICSSTDPLPIQEVFTDVGVPKRISLMVEGESLFSDSTALVAYTLLLAMLTGSAEPTIFSGLFAFIKVTIGGIIFGYIFARLFCWLISHVGESHIAKNTLSICLAYTSFFLVDDWFGYSGVIALVTASLVLATRGRSDYSPSSWLAFLDISGQINFIAKSIVFILVGVVIPSLIANYSIVDMQLLGIIFIAALAARFISVYVFLPALIALRLADPVENPLKAVMFWGAPRGAISLALVMAFLGMPGISDDDLRFVATTVSAFVLLTLLVNSTTMQLLLKFLKLKKLGKLDLAIKDRALFDAMTELSEEVETQLHGSELSQELLGDAVKHFDSRARDLFGKMARRSDLDHDEWLSIALTAVAQYEQRIYLKYLENRLVTSANARVLLSMVADLIDGVRNNGLQGYRNTTALNLKFDWYSRFAERIHASTGYEKLLEAELCIRYNKLFALVLVMEEIDANADTQVAKLVYRDLMDEAKQAIEYRLQFAREELHKIQKVFPEYAETLEQNLHKLSLIRLEQQKYQDMHDQAIISTEVYEELSTDVENQMQALSRPIKLDFKLSSAELLNQLPQFKNIDQQIKSSLLKCMSVKFYLPGTVIIPKGKHKKHFYLLVIGSIGCEGKTLTSGDCVGRQTFNISAQATSDIVSLEYSILLQIRLKKYTKLSKSEKELLDSCC